NPEIPIAKSLIDYIFRFLGTRFLSPEQKAEMGLAIADAAVPEMQPAAIEHATAARAHVVSALGFSPQADAPSCPDCGAIMVRNGSCYKCHNCGATSGCS